MASYIDTETDTERSILNAVSASVSASIPTSVSQHQCHNSVDPGPASISVATRAARSAAAPSPRPTLAPVALRPRRALVVDDSLVARLALMRVLEGEGWIVEAVESAAGLWHALEGGSWDVVFIDVSLPDARGREHLAQLVSRGLVMPEPFAVIALARDASEERLVQEAGIAQSLRKPFAPGVIEELVRGMRAVGRS